MLDRLPERLALALGGLSAALGGVVIVGWYTHTLALLQVHPSFVPMQYNTALGFLISGLGTAALSLGRARFTRACGAGAALVGGVTGLQYILGVDFGVDQLLMTHYVTVETSHPGRMAPNTALCFVVVGAALLADGVRRQWVMALLGGLASALGGAALIGYLSELTTAYGWGQLTQMAVHTAVGFVGLGIGVIAASWQRAQLRPLGIPLGIPLWMPLVLGLVLSSLVVSLQQAVLAAEGALGINTALPELLFVGGLTLAVSLAATLYFAQRTASHSAALERANVELERFVSVASHDLREPLRGIRGFVSLVQRRGADTLDESLLGYLKHAMTSVDQMDELITDLLAYARVQQGALQLEEVALDGVMSEVMARFSGALLEAEGSVDVGELPAVRGDASQLTQLLQNLVGNALKYHRPEVAPEVTVRAERSAGGWTVSVADNGIGIDEKYYAQIFEPFTRLHGRGAYNGSGVGLAICGEIVRRHGGEIAVRSVPGQGSIFSFTLPDDELKL